MKPSIGRIVHYVSYGTPGGEYPKACRAAVITGAGEPLPYPRHDDEHEPLDPDSAELVDLCVLNPTGLFFNQGVPQDEGAETPGDPNCPIKDQHGNPMRYCPCGWIEGKRRGGTWHWPERVED